MKNLKIYPKKTFFKKKESVKIISLVMLPVYYCAITLWANIAPKMNDWHFNENLKHNGNMALLHQSKILLSAYSKTKLERVKVKAI